MPYHATNFNPSPKDRFKPKHDVPMPKKLTVRVTLDMWEKVTSQPQPPEFLRSAIADALKLDALAQSLNITRSELIERIGRELLKVDWVP
jgi:hypothetical protein